ncbi:MAG: gliding motility-associated C-terminal domain-containing protein, partial [Flavobacteriaceae bacterium]|nr:gliding motility-associated C-terminal domain-containing protein [Flavobacteriaceae bacterium]
TSNGYLGTVNISSLTTPGTYVFTYSLDAVGVCPDASSSVTIILREILSSGIPSADNPASFCEADLPSSFDLFTLLDNEDPAGLWTQGTTSSDPAVSSPIDLSGFMPGTYDFTYSQNVDPNPCPEESTTVQVVVLQDPNAGVAINQVFCENDLTANSPFDLFDALDGSQDNNSGTWTDSAGTTISNILDITGFTISGSPYTFTYTIDNGTCVDSEDITITVEPAPESGTTNPDAEICVNDITTGETFDLFDLLEGEDQSGVWSDDTPSGALSGNLVTIDGLAPGTYDFTFDVNAIGSCDDVNLTVSIIINDISSPTGAASQLFCDGATIADLSATGNNILWYDEATGGTALASTDALVDGENYFATQTDAITGCESSVRFEVNVIINISPNSGLPNATPLTVCDNNSAVDLFNGLDGSEDATGTWFDTDGTGALSGNIFDATLVSAGGYQFTYTVTGIAPCVDSSTVITVTVEQTVFAGTDTSLDICSDEGTVDIFALLGGADAGGAWSPALTSGSNIFDPASDASGTYTYTISNSCSTDSSDIVITVTQAPDAGSDANADLCVVNGIVDLTTYLGGAPDSNGTWSPALASGTNDFDPTVDSPGTYIYTVSAITPCTTDASAQLTVTIGDSPEPIVVEPTLTFCLSANPTVADLNSAVTGDSILWYESDTSTNPLDPTDILLDGDDYYATQTSGSGCESTLRAQVNVIVNNADTPTLISEGDEFCINDSPTLFELTLNILEYDSGTNNITWYDSDTGGNVLSSTSLLVHDNVYYATLLDPITGCESGLRLPVTADLTACGALTFPDGFSPNGDGINDRYVVESIDFLYPNFVMEIYNRYGNLVYEGNARTSPFDGTSNQSRLVTQGDLPVGVYFYIINFNDGSKSKQGRLYLSR